MEVLVGPAQPCHYSDAESPLIAGLGWPQLLCTSGINAARVSSRSRWHDDSRRQKGEESDASGEADREPEHTHEDDIDIQVPGEPGAHPSDFLVRLPTMKVLCGARRHADGGPAAGTSGDRRQAKT